MILWNARDGLGCGTNGSLATLVVSEHGKVQADKGFSYPVHEGESSSRFLRLDLHVVCVPNCAQKFVSEFVSVSTRFYSMAIRCMLEKPAPYYGVQAGFERRVFFLVPVT